VLSGAGCTTVQPPTDECPDDCSDQGRCVDGKCVCFPGFSGPDCSESDCPGNCNDKGKCVDGQCVCDPGFTGPDCSQSSCPGNCNNRGRCVNGKCVCNPGFSGPDCSGKSCPKNCSNRGRCVNGKCVCDTGFTGPDCSARSCPRNCSNRGRCVNGKCVCEAGFSGPDCSERSCPGNCNNKGRCVNGQCVCDAGFSGPDCSAKTCPVNCNNRGRCVNGKCVCDEGYGGPDCSERTCPGNCNKKGRCVNGQCVCDPGFTGPDCSERTCPGNCNNKGRCVNGQCVCDPGFAGPDCSAKSCPNDCSDRGQCVDGECVCDEGFTGPDCSAKSCPNDCSNKGRCVDGKCVCDVGFTGPDCSTKTCPNNCSNRGRCVRGRCVCRRGFTGPDCSECEEGLTGPDCATGKLPRTSTLLSHTVFFKPCPFIIISRKLTVISFPFLILALTGVSRLSTRDITESSVTLFWTPPSVQYDTYYITFTSKVIPSHHHRHHQITTTEAAPELKLLLFILLISLYFTLNTHTHTHTDTTSVIVQWEQALGEIDRYILFVSPNQTDGSGRGRQEIKLPAERDSAQIEGLEPGRLYDISLVAEKDGARSLPSTTQATPDARKDPKLVILTEEHRRQDPKTGLATDKGARKQPKLPLITVKVTNQDSRLSTNKTVGKSKGMFDLAESEDGIDHVGVQNVTSRGFLVIWASPRGMFQNFVISLGERGKSGSEEEEEDKKEESPNVLGSSVDSHIVSLNRSDGGVIRKFTKVLPGSARSYPVSDLTPQTGYSVSLFGKGPGLRSNIHSFIISTGEPISVAVDGSDSTLPLSKLSPGSSYEVSVISLLGLDESDPIDGVVLTLPDPPTDLRAINVTDTKALLLWRPALATVDQYVIVYGSEEGDSLQVHYSYLHPVHYRYTTATSTQFTTGTLQLSPPSSLQVTTAISTQFTTGTLQSKKNNLLYLISGTLRFPFPSDCSQELMNGVRESGVVEIFPRGKEGKPVRVYCDMETDGGGWTVFQRRKDGKTNFFRGWQEYSKGFGELEGEFWLGNELLHNLTMMTPMSMRVDLRSGSESVYAAYSTFSVDTMKRHYTLRVSGYSGTAGDSMTYHDRRKFSTRDRDPQPFITRCAMSYKGGWWYKNCHEANLNGLYNTHTDHQGVIWTAWKGKDFSIPFAEMKLQPGRKRRGITQNTHTYTHTQICTV
uniref:Tenascin XB n=1 Tax=Astyanax mexicanus TaxID=7994 RepID=A0A8B9HZL9_ASTMX